MLRALITLALLFSTGVLGQTQPANRSQQLEQAYQEARAASIALREAELRRDQGIEAQQGERSAAAGGSRPSENYFVRQAMLEQEVEMARRRYDAAVRRWNDLK